MRNPLRGRRRPAVAVALVLAAATTAFVVNASTASAGGGPELADALARARVATAPYATDLARAKADGWNMQITPNMKRMGYHFLNPSVTGFDVTRPPILVYVKHGSDYQLVAFEWVFPTKPDTRPLPGATYGSFPAACHYDDGNFIPEPSQSDCPATHPDTGAAFTFWHPDFVTLHVWLWYPNPRGLYQSQNPFVAPFTGSGAMGSMSSMAHVHGH